MKHNTSKSKKAVASKGATENHSEVVEMKDPKVRLRELRDQMKQLREEAKAAQNIHVAARSEQRIEVVDRWLGIFTERLKNAERRIEKIKENIDALTARREKLLEIKDQKQAA